MYHSISLLHTTAPTSVTISPCIPYLCCTLSPPPLPAQNAVYLDLIHTHHPPASAALLCALRRIPESVAVYRIRLSPIFPSTCAQVPVSPWGVCPSWVSPSPLFLHLAPPVFWSDSCNLLFLGFLSDKYFRVRARSQGTSTPWQSLAPVLAPPPTAWSFRSRSVYSPSPPIPYPSPPCCIGSIPCRLK